MSNIPIGNTTPFRTTSEVGYKPPRQYCKRCGKQLLYIMTDDKGIPIEESQIQEEMTLGVCHNCYGKEIEELTRAMEAAQAAQEPTAEDKKIADDKYEEAVKKIMEELAKANGSDTPTNL
jgi:hypothetical protein